MLFVGLGLHQQPSNRPLQPPARYWKTRLRAAHLPSRFCLRYGTMPGFELEQFITCRRPFRSE
jgi:hypothetical protein